LGQFDAKEGLWQVVSEDSGVSISSKNKDHNIVNINGMVVDGQLSFNVITQLGQDITDKLSESLENNHKLVQAHTSNLVEQGISHKTPSDYNSDISLELLDRLQIQDNEVEYIYPANSLQQGFIYHALSNPDDDAYREQFIYLYDQKLDIDRYIKSWELAIARHPILRTAFNWEEDIVQVIYAKGDLEYSYHDISNQDDKEQAIQEIQEEDRKQGFDLTKPTQLRLHIIKQTDELYTVIKSVYHAIEDGWSGSLLIRDVHNFYNDLSLGNKILAVLDDTYLRVQEYIQNNRDKANEYWQENLVDIEVNDLSVLLTTDRNINEIKLLEGNYRETLTIEGELYAKLKDITKELGITINTLLQFVWHKLINIYTQDNQTIVGTTISGRNIAIDGIEDSVGLYINTLPLLVDWGNTNTIKEQLKYLHEQINNLNKYGYADLSKIQNSKDRLFHSLFIYQNYPSYDINKFIASKLLSFYSKLNYPVSLICSQLDNYIEINFLSSNEVIAIHQAKEYLSKFYYILQRVITKIDKDHNQISILSPQDYQRIVYDWNQTDSEYPRDKTIYELFEEQVKQNPNNIALVFEDKQLTYQELNNKSNQLARYIRKQYKEITSQELE
ncbi:condensation domain-containing protein, partial [Francisella philomiragia]